MARRIDKERIARIRGALAWSLGEGLVSIPTGAAVMRAFEQAAACRRLGAPESHSIAIERIRRFRQSGETRTVAARRRSD